MPTPWPSSLLYSAFSLSAPASRFFKSPRLIRRSFQSKSTVLTEAPLCFWQLREARFIKRKATPKKKNLQLTLCEGWPASLDLFKGQGRRVGVCKAKSAAASMSMGTEDRMFQDSLPLDWPDISCMTGPCRRCNNLCQMTMQIRYRCIPTPLQGVGRFKTKRDRRPTSILHRMPKHAHTHQPHLSRPVRPESDLCTKKKTFR